MSSETDTPVQAELAALRRHTAELEALLAAQTQALADGSAREETLRQQLSAERERSVTQFNGLLESAPDGIVIARSAGRIALVNRRVELLFGYERAELIEQPIEILLPERFHNAHTTHISRYVAKPQMRPMGAEQDLVARRKDGSEFPVEISLSPMGAGEDMLIISIIRDITVRRQAELERMRLQNEIILVQEMTLRELSTPLIPISEQVVIIPLIGSIDSRRAQQVVETLLHGIADGQMRAAIIDITGVAVVDTQVANILVQAAHGVRLLGARVLLTGIRPEIAQTLVGLGVDLGGIETHATLQRGITIVTRSLN